MPTQYTDLGKRAKKLLNDDYNSFHSKIKLSSSSGDGRTYTVSGVTDSKTQGVGCELAVKQKLGSRTVTTKLYTNGSCTSELALNTLGVKGLKGTVTGGLGGKSKYAGKLQLEFSGDGPVAAKSVTDFYEKTIDSSASCTISSSKLRGFAVCGVQAAYNYGDKSLLGVNGALSYFDVGGSEITLHLMDKGTKGKISYSHQVNKGFAAVAEMIYVHETEDIPQMTMGAAAELNDNTTLKGKLNSKGQIALTCLQTVQPGTTLTLSTSFDVKKMEAPKMGISIAIE